MNDRIIYQSDPVGTRFTDAYIPLRQKENRVFSDETVRRLPNIPADHSLSKEWNIRKHSLQKLIGYLHKKNSLKRILELGCGNGWLSHRLAVSLQVEVFAMDVNEIELNQGSVVFKEIKNLNFILGDIFTFDHKQKYFDIIILAASIQYFPDLSQIIKKLLSLLEAGGEIHLLDSPFYNSGQLPGARKRSEDYFNKLGFPAMNAHYHHHDWQLLKGFEHEILHDPSSLKSKIKKYILPVSPFPWIKITN